jgi:ubiquinone/menaquinone biosynthesis C-methylase UbiE
LLKNITETYDQLANTYENNVDMNSPYNTLYERPAMLKMIPEQLKDKKVLDAGCSAGWYSVELVKKGADVTGIDISPKMVEAAKRRLHNKAQFLCQDLQKELPFEDNKFDFIISSLTLHYIEDWESTFNEFNRVLKSAGTLLFSVHHPFMDFTNFNCEDYFQKQVLNDVWKKDGVTTEVSFYRRPMQSIISDTGQFFSIEKLVEPQPEERMKMTDPSSYSYLMTKPHFLIIKANSRK